jgi:hypothetical protein
LAHLRTFTDEGKVDPVAASSAKRLIQVVYRWFIRVPEAESRFLSEKDIETLGQIRGEFTTRCGRKRRLTQQVQISRPGDGLGAVGGLKLAVDIIDVGLDCTHRDEEVSGDLGVGSP